MMRTPTVQEDIKDEMSLVNEIEVATTKEIEAKLGFNRYLIEDVWAHGKQLLAKDNFQEKRQMTFHRKDRKRRINMVIMKCIEENPNSSKYTPKAEDETTKMPSWTRFVMEMHPK